MLITLISVQNKNYVFYSMLHISKFFSILWNIQCNILCIVNYDLNSWFFYFYIPYLILFSLFCLSISNNSNSMFYISNFFS